jgi:hypothetical protein
MATALVAKLRRHALSILLVLGSAAVVCVFFAGVYRRIREPIGFDTPLYITQANLVARHGLAGVADLLIPRPHKLWTSRVAFPVTGLSLSGLFGTSIFTFAAVLPIGAIVIAASCAGAFASYALRRGAVTLAVVAVVVGTSVAMTQLVAGTYQENLLAQAMFVTALVPLAGFVGGGRGLVAGAALLGAGGLAHQPTYGSMLAVLVLAVLVYVPISWRARRAGRSWWSLPAVRLGAAVAGAGATTAAGIYGAVRTTPYPALLKRQEFEPKIRFLFPLYRLPFVVPVAVAGAVAEAQSIRRRRSGRPAPPATTFFLVVSAAWTAVSLVGIAGYYLGRAWPAHRLLAFLLPLPVFAALGLLALARLAARRVTRPVAVAILAAGLVGAMAIGWVSLYRAEARRGLVYLPVERLRDAQTAEAYVRVAGIPSSSPVVVLLDDRGPDPQLAIPALANQVRTVWDAATVERTWFYVGTPDNFVARQPTLLPEDTKRYNVVSNRFWKQLQPALSANPVALLLRSTNPSFDVYAAQHPDRVVAPNLIAIGAPGTVAATIAPGTPPTAPNGWVPATLWAVATLLTLGVIGSGWTVALLPADVRPFERVALASGVGLGFLVIAGTAVDPLGIRPAGVSGAFLITGTTMTGWVSAWLAARRRRATPAPPSSPPPGPRPLPPA